MKYLTSLKNIKYLSPEEILLVDRDILNERISYLISTGSNNCSESLLLLLHTLSKTLSQEYATKTLMSYVPFSVKDILKLFPDYESLPITAFARVDN